MKPKPLFRIVFIVLAVLGSILILQGARSVSAENTGLQSCLRDDCSNQAFEQTNTEYIFFESVTKFLVISLVR